VNGYCGTVLGIAADRARLRLDYARSLERLLDGHSADAEMPKLVRELVETRLRIAPGEPRPPLEFRTDDVLESIAIQERTSG
jgi:hypothetical protein